MEELNQCRYFGQRLYSDYYIPNYEVDMPEENENEVVGEENEEQSYTVENPSLDLEVGYDKIQYSTNPLQ